MTHLDHLFRELEMVIQGHKTYAPIKAPQAIQIQKELLDLIADRDRLADKLKAIHEMTADNK